MALFAAVAALAAGVAVAAGDPYGVPAAALNEAAANTAAQNDLSLTPLPPGATVSAIDPSVNGVLAVNGAGTPAVQNIVDLDEYWTVPGTPQTVFSYIESNLPAGSTNTGTSHSTVHGRPSTSTVMFSFGVDPSMLQLNDLDVTVAAAAGGGSAVRADGVAQWIAPPVVSQTIPAGATSVAVYADRTYATTPQGYLVKTITAPGEVTQLVNLINSFQTTQPGVAEGCPAIGPSTPLIDLRFDAGDPRAPLARVVEDACGALSFYINGQQQTGLQESTDLPSLLWQMHALPACTPGDLRPTPASGPRREGLASPYISTRLSFTNSTSRSVCALDGFPQIRLRERQRALPTRVTDVGGQPAPTILMPNVAAQITLNWPAPKHCDHPTATAVSVQLPGISHHFQIDVGSTTRPVAPCDGHLNTTAVTRKF
jgi:hypothetical protein